MYCHIVIVILLRTPTDIIVIFYFRSHFCVWAYTCILLFVILVFKYCIGCSLSDEYYRF